MPRRPISPAVSPAAMDSLAEALTSLRNRMSSGPAPDAKALAGTLAGIQLSLGGGMGTLLGRMEAGAAGAEARLAETGAAALEALTGITASNDEMTGQAESGFATEMSGVMSGASHAFGHLTNGHVQKAQQSTTRRARRACRRPLPGSKARSRRLASGSTRRSPRRCRSSTAS